MTNVNSGLQAGRDINIHNSTVNQIGPGTDIQNGRSPPSQPLALIARLMIKSMSAVSRLPQHEMPSGPPAFSTWYRSLDNKIGRVPIMAREGRSAVDQRKSWLWKVNTNGVHR